MFQLLIVLGTPTIPNIPDAMSRIIFPQTNSLGMRVKKSCPTLVYSADCPWPFQKHAHVRSSYISYLMPEIMH